MTPILKKGLIMKKGMLQNRFIMSKIIDCEFTRSIEKYRMEVWIQTDDTILNIGHFYSNKKRLTKDSLIGLTVAQVKLLLQSTNERRFA